MTGEDVQPKVDCRATLTRVFGTAAVEAWVRREIVTAPTGPNQTQLLWQVSTGKLGV